MVQNGSNVQLVTESEGILYFHAFVICIISYLSNLWMTVGRVRDVITLSTCFLQITAVEIISHSSLECWRINTTKYWRRWWTGDWRSFVHGTKWEQCRAYSTKRRT